MILECRLIITATLTAATLGVGGLNADTGNADWAQWRGPNRDGISTETGLLTTWPEGGPEVLWRIPIGGGYSSVAIADGLLYTMAGKGPDEFILCLDAATGEEMWRYRSDSNFIQHHGNGPRSTPIIEGDRLYVRAPRESCMLSIRKPATRSGAGTCAESSVAEFPGGVSPLPP